MTTQTNEIMQWFKPPPPAPPPNRIRNEWLPEELEMTPAET
jgi:hypothetical protein